MKQREKGGGIGNAMDVGQRIREGREGLGMPQSELARRVGVARNDVAMIETGRSIPSVGLVEKIARELSMGPAELLTEPEAKVYWWKR
jgi:transcriptional regulator with XRE-family HTH domain